jgi:hypothetical protein
MKEDKRECSKEKNKDGMHHILFTLVVWLKNNKSTEIISKLICKTLRKMKKLKNFLIDKSFYHYHDIISIDLISKKYMFMELKMTNLHMLKKKFSNLNTEKLLMMLIHMVEEIKEWLKDKDKDSNKTMLIFSLLTTLINQNNMRINI